MSGLPHVETPLCGGAEIPQFEAWNVRPREPGAALLSADRITSTMIVIT
jgi:hypothetical protein